MESLPVIQDSGRCTGHCCHRFPLGGGGEFFDGSKESMAELLASGPDGPILVDMLQPFYGPLVEDDIPRFTCRHFDFEAKSCTNYENRPALCRKHGVTDHLCGEEECTLSVKITKQILVGGLQYEGCDKKEESYGDECRA